MKKLVLAIFISLTGFSTQAQSGYDITINLKNCKDTIAFLTFYQFDKTFIKDTCTSIKNGKIVFKGKTKLDKGIYSLVGQQKSIYFDFFIDDNIQKIHLSSEAGDNIIDALSAENAPRQNEFFDYVRYIGKQNKDFGELKKQTSLLTKKDTLYLTDKQKEFEDRIREYEEKFLVKQKGTFIGDVVNIKIEKILKDIPKASNGRPDSLAVYNYYKQHYWDNVDFKDNATMRNPFFFNKLKNYLDKVVFRHPDSVSVEVDKIIQKTQQGSSLYKIMLAHLTYSYETSKVMGFDKVFVHIIDNYFKTGKAFGIYEDESVVDKIIKRADLLRPLLIGAKAPELQMIKATDYDKIDKMGFELAKTNEEVTKIFYANYNEINKMLYKLSSVKADYLILAFWDVDCGHCQVEIPKLLEVYHDLQKQNIDIQVFSVYTQHEGDKYLKYIAEKGLDWINVYDGVHYNNVAEKYDVYSTPVIYILDKNKIIKAKRVGVEQIKDIVKIMQEEYQKN